MFYILQVNPYVWLLSCCGIIAALLFYIIGIRRYSKAATIIINQSKAESAIIPTDKQGKPLRISVVAYSKADTNIITSFLQEIATQEYPDTEVIVVIDGSARDASDLNEIFSDKYANVHFTFVPPEATNLSRRKLANTIGIKSATGEIILTTLTNIHAPSTKWLTLMASEFANPEVEIVLGAAMMNLTRLTGIKTFFRRFCSVITTTQWMTFAIKGTPYRGDGANLAFRRDLFFRNSGYGNNYYLHAGDDDIFVSQVATSSNSRYMFAAQATLQVDWGDNSNRMWKILHERYAFTSRYLNSAPRQQKTAMNICNWTAIAAFLSAIILSTPHGLIATFIAATALATHWAGQLALYRRLATALQISNQLWCIPLCYLMLPIADIMLHYRLCRHRNSNFTWQR